MLCVILYFYIIVYNNNMLLPLVYLTLMRLLYFLMNNVVAADQLHVHACSYYTWLAWHNIMLAICVCFVCVHVCVRTCVCVVRTCVFIYMVESEWDCEIVRFLYEYYVYACLNVNMTLCTCGRVHIHVHAMWANTAASSITCIHPHVRTHCRYAWNLHVHISLNAFL